MACETGLLSVARSTPDAADPAGREGRKQRAATAYERDPDDAIIGREMV